MGVLAHRLTLVSFHAACGYPCPLGKWGCGPPRPGTELTTDRNEWDLQYAGHNLIWSAEPNQFFAAEVAGLPPGRAIDLACGEGRNAIWLAANGWDVTAVDFSQAGLDKAQSIAAARGVAVTWVLADLLEYGPSPASFDLVAVIYLHLPAPARRLVLGRAADAVAAGGTLLVVAHDKTNLRDGWGGPQDPAVLYGPDDLTADLTGLDITRAERVTRDVVTDLGPKVAIDVLVRATRPA